VAHRTSPSERNPHCTQNFARSGFSATQFEQRIANPPIARQTVESKARFQGHRKGSIGATGEPCRRSWPPHFPTTAGVQSLASARIQYDEILCLSPISKAAIKFKGSKPYRSALAPVA